MLTRNGAASRAYKRQRFRLALTAIAIPKRIRHRRLCPVEVQGYRQIRTQLCRIEP